MLNAKMIKVIVTDLYLAGKGTPESPYRRLTQYWTLDGELLATVDPIKPKETKENENGISTHKI
ncbi:MAG: carboxypeptidase [Candidatus Hodarchaeales archaeon]|jgi:hypothetical protein